MPTVSAPIQTKRVTSKGKHGNLPVRGKAVHPKSVNTVRADAIRNKIVEIAHEEAEGMVRAMAKAAKGEVFITKELSDGRTMTEQRPPDVNAYRALTEQAIGKPKETIDLVAKVGIVQLVQQLEVEDVEE